MKYNIRGNKIDVTAAIEDYIKQKISKVEKYFNDSAEAKAIISAKGKDQKVEVTIWSGKYNVRAEETHEDLYAAIDLVLDKLERQLKKYKDKIQTTKRTTTKEEYVPEIEEYFEEEEQNIVRRKQVFLKPIDEDEAITQMELLGHSFFVFKNVETDKINVCYKRKDGDYGIIEAN